MATPTWAQCEAAIVTMIDEIAEIARVYPQPPNAAPQDVPAAFIMPAAIVGVDRANGLRTTTYRQPTRILVKRGAKLSEAVAEIATIRDALLDKFDEHQVLGLGEGVALEGQEITEADGIQFPAGAQGEAFLYMDQILEITISAPRDFGA